MVLVTPYCLITKINWHVDPVTYLLKACWTSWLNSLLKEDTLHESSLSDISWHTDYNVMIKDDISQSFRQKLNKRTDSCRHVLLITGAIILKRPRRAWEFCWRAWMSVKGSRWTGADVLFLFLKYYLSLWCIPSFCRGHLKTLVLWISVSFQLLTLQLPFRQKGPGPVGPFDLRAAGKGINNFKVKFDVGYVNEMYFF